MSSAGFSDLLASLLFAALMVALGLAERLLGCDDGRLVLLLTAEYAAQAPHRLGFKVLPQRSRDGYRKPAEVKRRYINAAPQ
jgi:hypothetical protein